MVRLVNCVAYGVQRNYALFGMLFQLTYVLSFIYCRLCVFTVTHPSVMETQITGSLPGCSKACSGLSYQTSAIPVHRYKCTEMHIYAVITYGYMWIDISLYISKHTYVHISTISYSLELCPSKLTSMQTCRILPGSGLPDSEPLGVQNDRCTWICYTCILFTGLSFWCRVDVWSVSVSPSTTTLIALI